MPAPLEFYFDFSSPYGFLAALRVDDIAARHGRAVTWRPILLGAVFKVSGRRPLLDIPLKGDYTRHDLARFARLWGASFTMPPVFPFSSVAASRLFYWLADADPARAIPFAKAAFAAAWQQHRDLGAPEVAVAVAAECGIDAQAARAALAAPAVKERLRAEVDAAIAKGVFGSPHVVVDGEGFWGADRLWQVEEWLARGGW